MLLLHKAYESTEKEEKPIVKKVIEKGPIQSFDVSGPDICEILKKRYDYTVFPESNYEHFHKEINTFAFHWTLQPFVLQESKSRHSVQ